MRMLTGRVATIDVRRAKPPPKKADPFYLSREWRALVGSLIADRFGSRAAAHCEDPACAVAHLRGIRLIADHVHERTDGGASLDPANILFRCYPCHARKTAAAAASRAARG